MEKLIYEYSNGFKKVHTIFIINKTILKEANGAKQVTIYKCNEYEIDQRLDNKTAGQYITTLLLN